jgi:hypothetical protein
MIGSASQNRVKKADFMRASSGVYGTSKAWLRENRKVLTICQDHRRSNVDLYSALFFGGLAILVTNLVTVDPLALRRRFSPGLPLSKLLELIVS